MNDVEERREAIHVVQFASQSAGEIEAETIDVHLRGPVAQAVHDELQNLRMTHIQGVSRAGVVHVEARHLRDEAIVSRNYRCHES